MNYTLVTLLVVILLLTLDTRRKVIAPASKASKNELIMDTSALIDARVLDVASAGFINDRIIIPQFVLHELQLLADGRDSYKRERARIGLDTVHSLQALSQQVIIDRSTKGLSENETDKRLVQLAKKRRARLCTTDFNLNKVAVAEGVVVLNINELAQVIRAKILPGENLVVKILQKGETRTQGVGYLEDGTMVVVVGAGHLVGKQVAAITDKLIQTKAGKMLFATIDQSI